MKALVTLKRALIALCCVAAAAGCARKTDDAAPAAASTKATATTMAAAATEAVPDISSSPAAAASEARVVAGRSAELPLSPDGASIDGPAADAAAMSLPAAPTVSTSDSGSDRLSFAPLPPSRRPGESSYAPRAASFASTAAHDALDVTSLLTRLRKTKAINLRTKLAVKNESDDLMERFRTYHAHLGTATLADLRMSYDSLFHRLYSLLENDDPPLAREIDRSRAAIWAILADPVQFGLAVPNVSTRREPTA